LDDQTLYKVQLSDAFSLSFTGPEEVTSYIGGTKMLFYGIWDAGSIYNKFDTRHARMFANNDVIVVDCAGFYDNRGSHKIRCCAVSVDSGVTWKVVHFPEILETYNDKPWKYYIGRRPILGHDTYVWDFTKSPWKN
jgi:hypothetical protein